MIAALVLSTMLAPEPSVLLISLDTFRGDYLGLVGSERAATPHLDALAAEGTWFTRARAPVPLTLPSHASIFTGLYPPQHGVRDNGTFRLHDAHTTLAEVLHSRGYRTAAFIGSFVLEARFGLAQGFDHYDDAVVGDIDDLENPAAERRGDDVAAAFAAWLGGVANDRPFFAWVHLYDPHAPYEAPEPFRSRYPQDPYAAEIAYTDAVVGRLVELVDRSSTLVVVVGDHGEGLGEHGETTHSLLIYNSTLHVPLIVSGPRVSAGVRIERVVRTIDVAATILDVLGVESTLGDGVSLLKAPDDEVAAYSESLYGFHHLGWSPLYGLETATHRFIDAPERELYDLTSDPREHKNVVEEQRATSRTLFRELNELREALGTDDVATLDIDPETRARLESLGYVTSPALATTTAPSGLPDPKRELETYDRIQRAQLARNLGHCRAALDELSDVRQAIPLVYELRAHCLMAMEEWNDARAVLDEAIANGMETSGFHLNLGIVEFHRGRLDVAERELRIAIALEEGNVSAHYHLGNVLRAGRRDAEAIAAYRSALAINSDYVFAWNGLGMSLARSGDNDEALDAFRRATETPAAEPRAHFNLAIQAERMGLGDEALASYRRFLDIADGASYSRERARAREAIDRLEKR